MAAQEAEFPFGVSRVPLCGRFELELPMRFERGAVTDEFIVSIDVGVKNLGVAIFRRDGFVKPMRLYILRAEVYDFSERRDKRPGIDYEEMARVISGVFDFAPFKHTTVIVERQGAFGYRGAVRNNSFVEGLLVGLASERGLPVEFADPSAIKRHFEFPKSSRRQQQYALNKRFACMLIAQRWPSIPTHIFSSDHICDAILNAIYITERTSREKHDFVSKYYQTGLIPEHIWTQWRETLFDGTH